MFFCQEFIVNKNKWLVLTVVSLYISFIIYILVQNIFKFAVANHLQDQMYTVPDCVLYCIVCCSS